MGYPFGPLYRLLLLTGQRRTEWAAASRSEINLDKGWLEVPKARYKGDRDHVVPLAEKSLGIVKELPAWPGNDYFLFSTRDGRMPISGFSKGKVRLDEQVKRAMASQTPELVFVPYRVHDLRVTCETRLATLGYNQDVRDAVLGHAKPGLQKTYNKYDYFEEKRSALARYANHVIWPALAIARERAPWGFAQLAEVERWFGALEPVLAPRRAARPPSLRAAAGGA